MTQRGADENSPPNASLGRGLPKVVEEVGPSERLSEMEVLEFEALGFQG